MHESVTQGDTQVGQIHKRSAKIILERSFGKLEPTWKFVKKTEKANNQNSWKNTRRILHEPINFATTL